MKICAIIPAFNEEKNIAELVRRVLPHVESALVVDDGSKDGTGAVAEAAGASVVRHAQNRGKGEALKSGYEWAARNSFDAFFTIDADLQHSPDEMGRFVDCMKKTGADIVLGNRMNETRTMPFERFVTNVLTSLVVNFAGGLSIHDSQVGFRLVRTAVIKKLRVESSKYDHETEILIKAGRRAFVVREVPISTIYLGGPSKIHPIRDSLRFIRLIGRLYL